MTPPERWKAVSGYEGCYEVSTHGRVRSLKFGKCKVVRQHIHTTGYFTVILCKHGVRKNYRVHRLVADAFCKQPDGCDVVNHIDHKKTNNHCLNLEWVTPAGNAQARTNHMFGYKQLELF